MSMSCGSARRAGFRKLLKFQKLLTLQKLCCFIAIAFFSLQAFAAPALATGIYSMPQSANAWIVDEADQISRINEGKIESSLKQLAAQTGNEVRFVTIHRLDYEETAQSFADQLAEKWFPTPEARANQTVIVLDDVTNSIGLSIGENSSAALSDEIAQSVVGETMKVPLLRGNQYNQAFVDATTRIVAVMSGEPDPGAPEYDDTINTDRNFATAEETEATRGSSTTLVIVLLIAATVIPMATYYWYISAGG
ncbi:MAG: YgcG family protein [Phormidesmis sp.]